MNFLLGSLMLFWKIFGDGQFIAYIGIRKLCAAWQYLRKKPPGAGRKQISVPQMCATKSGFPKFPQYITNYLLVPVGVEDFLICSKTSSHFVFLHGGLSESVGLA